jgi:hypothetical protein
MQVKMSELMFWQAEHTKMLAEKMGIPNLSLTKLYGVDPKTAALSVKTQLVIIEAVSGETIEVVKD